MAKRKVTIKRDNLKTNIFRVVLEEDRWPDEPPSEAVWRAYVPSLESLGASTWGETPQEALKNIQEVLEMILEEFAEEGKPLPRSAQVTVLKGPAVSVTR
jgi:predicted RNase H-like HicB family nuclease